MPLLQCGSFAVDLSRPRIMAIVNVTPDSFSGDGHHHNAAAAVRSAEEAIAAGADFIDLGGESSRPGAESVSEQEELDRVIPVVERLAGCGVPVSVDTVKPVVMRESIAAGASMINDINAFRAEGALEAVRGSTAALCVMHMQGAPRVMQADPHYKDVVVEVREFLARRVADLLATGVSPSQITIDPGFGFGKTVGHNLALMRALPQFAADGWPVLIGVSRKSMIGAITGRPPGARLVGSVAAALLAVERGAHIVRVHDVAATRDALAVWEAIRGEVG